MKAVFYFLIILACLGVGVFAASTGSSSSVTTASSTETPVTTGSSTPAVTGSTGTTTPSGAANVYCSVSVTMAVAALALLRL